MDQSLTDSLDYWWWPFWLRHLFGSSSLCCRRVAGAYAMPVLRCQQSYPLINTNATSIKAHWGHHSTTARIVLAQELTCKEASQLQWLEEAGLEPWYPASYPMSWVVRSPSWSEPSFGALGLPSSAHPRILECSLSVESSTDSVSGSALHKSPFTFPSWRHLASVDAL